MISSYNFQELIETSAVLDAAHMLGIDIKKLYYGTYNSSSPSEIVVGIDRYKKKFGKLKLLLDQKKGEGRNIALVKNSSAAIINDHENVIMSSARPTPMSADIKSEKSDSDNYEKEKLLHEQPEESIELISKCDTEESQLGLMYKCQKCPYAASDASNLKHHLRTHSVKKAVLMSTMPI